jgi:hypothetical protein
LRALKRTWAQKPLKNLTYPNQKWQNPKKGGRGGVNRKVFEQNTKKESQMLHGHPLTLGMHQQWTSSSKTFNKKYEKMEPKPNGMGP